MKVSIVDQLSKGADYLGLIEIILIAAGTSLDIVGVMICFGARLPQVHKKTLLRLCSMVAPWQMLVLLVGNGLSRTFPGIGNPLIMGTCSALAATIFLILSIYMFVKAYKSTPVFEYRIDHLETKTIFFSAVALSVDNFLAGAGMGLMNAKLTAELAATGLASLGAIISGIYLGYYLGIEQRAKVYIVSGILLCIAGVDVLVRFLIA
jgi:putative Mn2+ efflux pump MntP